MAATTPIPPIPDPEIASLVRTLIAKNEEYAGMILALREQVQLLKTRLSPYPFA
jgi:hypothetical protein